MINELDGEKSCNYYLISKKIKALKEDTMTVKIGVLGYGNLGRGIESEIRKNPDMELYGVFTRRDKASVKAAEGTRVFSIEEAADHKDDIDVMILCGGSATDLPKQTPEYASMFNVVDSFDTHANISEHFDSVCASALKAGKTALISCGWDPGMFSLARLYGSCILPSGKDYTFWGKGISQGHSDAIRRIEGVLDARQYTIPVKEALEAAKSGEKPELTTRQKHTRECFVVAEDGADLKAIESQIVNMPNYFADYDTTVHFVTMEELKRDHSGMPHGGTVIRSGETGPENEYKDVIEYKLKLDSNPYFTSSVLLAFARAVARLNREGKTGALTVFDIAPAYLSLLSGEELRKHML